MKITISLALIGLCAAISSCATELPAVKYIDADNVDKTFESQRIFFGKFVEEYGGKTAQESARSLEELNENIRELLSSQDAQDKFNLRDKFDVRGLKNLQKYLQPLSDIARDPERNSARCSLKQFLDTIKMFFGKDLQGFAKGKVTHDAKLHAFLLEYSKSIVSLWIGLAVLSRESPTGPQRYLERAVAHDLPSGYTNEALIRKAQKMNFIKGTFDANAMLDAVGQVDFGTDDFVQDKEEDYLSNKLEEVCEEFDSRYGFATEIYTWTRLVAPEKVPQTFLYKDLFRLTEYWRICLPLLNPETRVKVAKNIKRNMGQKRKLFG